MDAAERAARAGFALGSALFALALPNPSPEGRACLHPAELAARAGRTVEVGCDQAAPQLSAPRGPARRLVGLAIDLNAADTLTLETLPGIGPVRAEAIACERARHPFEEVADLARVPGIGPRTVERLAGIVAVGESPVPGSENPVSCGAQGGRPRGQPAPTRREAAR